LDDQERGEAKDRVPPGVGYHYVIPTWQSFIFGNIEKELYETLEQRPANVVDILSSADAVAVASWETDRPIRSRLVDLFEVSDSMRPRTTF